MNKENAKDFLPLVQALAEGKTIQYSYYKDGWKDIEGPSLLGRPEQWRIKPETKQAKGRVFLYKHLTTTGSFSALSLSLPESYLFHEAQPYFIKWVDDEITVEYEQP